MSFFLRLKCSMKNMVIKWPPLFLFSVCLLVISLCSFGVGVYVLKHQLKNPNVISWNAFMTEVTKHVFCAKSVRVAEVPDNNTGLQHIEAAFRWRIGAKTLNPLSSEGSFVMLGKSGYNVSLSSLTAAVGEHAACLHVRGPAALLPSIRSASVPSPANCSAALTAPSILPSLKPRPVVPDAACQGSSYSLKFTSDYRLDAFLSEDERQLIFSRMCRVSLLLLSLSVIVVFLHLVRDVLSRSQPAEDKAPFLHTR